MSRTAVRAFVGSQGLGALSGWLDELPRRPRHAALVPTAGNPLPSTPWVDEAAGRRRDRYAKLIAEYGERYRFVPVDDDEAVVVTGETWQKRPSAILA